MLDKVIIIRILPLSRKNLLILNVRRNEIKTKCGTEGVNNFDMRQNLFCFVSEITFFFSNYRDYIVNKSQTIDCLLAVFLRVRCLTLTSIVVCIKRLRLLWNEKKKLFCRSRFLSLLWKPMWTTATLEKFTNNATLTLRNMFVSSGIWNLWFYLRRLSWIITFYWASCWWWWFLNLNSIINFL